MCYNKGTKTKERGDKNSMKKKQIYLVLDTETATLNLAHTTHEINKQDFALKKPLVYDIGWVLMDRQGNILKRVNYIVQEIFFDTDIFNTAYYADKRPKYYKALTKGKVEVRKWADIMEELQTDLDKSHSVCAYNANFDFKRAIPYTERFMKAWYSDWFEWWEKNQFDNFVNKVKPESKADDKYKMPIFEFRGKDYPIIDIWAVACDKLINNKRYKKFCIDNDYVGSMYFKTSAEIAYRYLQKELDFIEAHTALNDAEIESVILAKALKKGKVIPTLEFMPCRKLGTVKNFTKSA